MSREGAAAVPSAAEVGAEAAAAAAAAVAALLRNRNAELLQARPLTCSVEQFKYPLALSCLGWFFFLLSFFIFMGKKGGRGVRF